MTGQRDFAPAAELTAEWGGRPALQALGESADPFELAAVPGTWRPKDRHFGVHRDGRLVAHAGFVVAPVEVGGRRFEVAGIGGCWSRRTGAATAWPGPSSPPRWTRPGPTAWNSRCCSACPTGPRCTPASAGRRCPAR